MVVPEMNSDSEEETNDFAYASFISARKKSKEQKKEKAGDGKVVHEKVVPVVNVDVEAEEEPSSLTHKSSKQKHSHSQSIRHISTNAKSPSKSVDAASSEKLVKSSGDKTVKESGDKSDDEEEEKSGEHMHKRSVEKGKSICKSVKSKMDDDEEPGSIKKAIVSESLSSEKRKLRNQKVLWGRTFACDILELAGMRQLVDICDSQQWTNFFYK
ncbi:uncharacterized protein [Nicotiana sylvestris]|uniref:uncharacterized protein n=1 Tax=Nicotiana sylvestris TaxID=4096 RepID=UPI00388C7E1C